MRACTGCQETKADNEFYKRTYQKGSTDLKKECKSCFKQRMGKRHQAHKTILVSEAGGKCSKCGYNKEPRILNFHHLDKAAKKFGIAKRLSANIETLRKEAAKCVLLCPNCHQEHHVSFG